MTINSFTSLSLEPPLIMWNLRKGSDTYKSWHDVENFAVNFLRAEQEQQSLYYARQGDHSLPVEAIARGSSGCPMLADCLANVECTMHARYEEGDHAIIVGEVINLISQPDKLPLVFHKGRYTTVANARN